MLIKNGPVGEIDVGRPAGGWVLNVNIGGQPEAFHKIVRHNRDFVFAAARVGLRKMGFNARLRIQGDLEPPHRLRGEKFTERRKSLGRQ